MVGIFFEIHKCGVNSSWFTESKHWQLPLVAVVVESKVNIPQVLMILLLLFVIKIIKITGGDYTLENESEDVFLLFFQYDSIQYLLFSGRMNDFLLANCLVDLLFLLFLFFTVIFQVNFLFFSPYSKVSFDKETIILVFCFFLQEFLFNFLL